MYNKTQILNKVDSLASGAVNSGFDRARINTLVQPLKNAIESFYNLDFNSYVEGNIEMLTHGLIRTNIKYKNYQVGNSGQNVPKGFNDLTELFTVGSALMTCNNTTFNRSITEAVLPSDEGDGIVYQSNLVDTWVNEWLSALITVPANLQLIGDVAGEMGLISGVKIIFDPPTIESVPSTADFAKDIFINRKYKEVIDTLGLSVYVPNNI